MALKSVKEYLESRGHRFEMEGDLWVTRSPFSRDTTPSFKIYPDGRFKDYSSGLAGNVFTLIRELGDTYDSAKSLADWEAKPRKERKPLDGYVPIRNLTLTDEEFERTVAYALRRRITKEYLPGVYNLRGERRPALVFEHRMDGKIIGAKFRIVGGEKGDRMRMMGKPGFYILGNPKGAKFYYLVESETSANSLWMYTGALVVSHGAVSTVPKTAPFDLPARKILDYDGSEELWKSRIAKYAHIKGDNIKLPLPKGEDINSLYCKNEMYKIDFLL